MSDEPRDPGELVEAEHAGDERISAYLDDELSPPERALFERDLAGSAELAAATEVIRSVRRDLRALPDVEPPFGFYERLVSPRRRRGGLVARVAGVAAIAAAVLLVFGVFSGTQGARIVPALGDYFDQHAAAAPGFAAVDMNLGRATAPDMAPMELSAVFSRDDVMHYRYDAAAMGTVSVFVEPGRCNFAGLPAGGSRMNLAGRAAWHAPSMHGQSVVVLETQREGRTIVVTVIGPGDHDAEVVEAAGHLV